MTHSTSAEGIGTGSYLASVMVAVFLVATATPVLALRGDCLQPATDGAAPTATDCLFVLRASVGSAVCTPQCICDPNDSASITATDALVCLRSAVGQPVALECPCALPTTSTTTMSGATTTTSTTTSTTLAGYASIAHADFDGDTPGGYPDTTLPGGPTGDYLRFMLTAGISSFTVADSAGGITTQPLVGERTSGPGSFNFSVRWPSEFYTSQEFLIRWHWSGFAGLPQTFVILRGPNLQVHGSLKLLATEVRLSTALSTESTVATLTQGTPHTFEWTLDRTTGVQSLSVDGDLVVDGVETSWKQPGVDAAYLSFEGGGQSAMSVAFDDIDVYVGIGQ
jgi:hypothetical protein